MFGGSTMTTETTPGPTWFEERNRRKAAEADEVTRAFDAVEQRRLDAELTRAFVSNGVGKVEPIGTDDRARVGQLIARDRAERETERRRGLAEVQARNGDFTNLADTVQPPTPEWLAKHETRTFTPKQPDGTVRVIRTVRRVATPIVKRMHLAGKLSDDHYHACLWYRTMHDIAGVTGRYKTSHLSLAGNTGGSGGMAQHPMAQHQAEAEAREAFRDAREAITAFYLLFLDKVVLEDIPLSRAWRFARCPRDKAEHRFRVVAGELLAYCRTIKATMVDDED